MGGEVGSSLVARKTGACLPHLLEKGGPFKGFALLGFGNNTIILAGMFEDVVEQGVVEPVFVEKVMKFFDIIVVLSHGIYVFSVKAIVFSSV